MVKPLRFLNPVALAVTIGINYLSNTGAFNGATVGSVSARFPSLITPAPYAFIIWALIYGSLCAFALYHLRRTPNADTGLRRVSLWFLLSCILNCCWILVWVYGHIGWSVVIILLLLLCLLRIMVRTEMELTDAPRTMVMFLWWPFCLYLGWIVLAATVNVAAWITWRRWTPFGLAPTAFAITLLLLTGVVYLFLTWRRNLREAALVGAWGMVAVGVADRSNASDITWMAWAVAFVLLVSSSIHGYRNRKYSPFAKRHGRR